MDLQDIFFYLIIEHGDDYLIKAASTILFRKSSKQLIQTSIQKNNLLSHIIKIIDVKYTAIFLLQKFEK